MADFITHVNTYKVNKPTICFKCRLFFDRIDCHVFRKHCDRSTNDYKELKTLYKIQIKKVLDEANLGKRKKHNVRDTIQCMNEFNGTAAGTSSALDEVSAVQKGNQ